jgi:prepilin peptidase CpaA
MQLLPSGLAALAASIALVTDVRARRIPNWLTLATLIAGVLANVWLNGLEGGAQAAIGAALGFVALIPFYAVRAVGAGDVKLLAAIGALVGPAGLLPVAVYGGVVGGVMSIVLLAKHRRLSFTLQEVLMLHGMPSRSGIKTPYAVAIAGGVYLALIPGFSSFLVGGS